MINIEAKVTAGAKSNSFKKENGIYYIRITAKAIDGKANKSIIEFLSEELNLKKKDIEIIRGGKSSKKIISINIEDNILEEYFKNNL
ncbi:DUF167 domain-containing protein [Brachyspira catarrhinii]|uniref:UPF0235 protein EZH24_02475 n=1 Tax=Brachyspira catarrhinii TaxID=2528966 RepID=A0ABY2TTB6_9SPIR|nr:DUF167 domain-containing protein [Brachyspira catarrhinii]TKZ35985.1 DUF167 domain-containing protein [Brachyspira catarrhinii]